MQRVCLGLCWRSRDRHLHRPAGTREALPGTIAGLAPRVLRLALEKRVEDYAKIQRKDLKPVGQHLLNRADVGLAYKRQLLELTHTALLLRSGEMALAGVHANDLAGRSDLEALGGAAMRFQFLLWLSRISRHCWILSKKFVCAKPNVQAGCAACCGLGLATGTPFLGASSATRTLPSMRGIVSIWPCSPISPSRRVILARPTSW